MPTSTKRKRLLDAYRFAGFRPLEQLRGVFGDPLARVLTLTRRSKKQLAVHVAECSRVGTIAGRDACAICHAGHIACMSSSRFGAYFAEAARL
jgi:hypothetical protein